MTAARTDLWLVSKGFDGLFFFWSGALCLLLLLPYLAFGNSVIIPIYNIYLVFFGLPHNYMTWASILPASARKTINMQLVTQAGLICLVLCLILLMEPESELRNWILTIITLASVWHAYRQHHGICKIYDGVQAARTGDSSVFTDRKAMNLFFGLANGALVLWVFTHADINYLLSDDEYYPLVYPLIPGSVFQAYLAATAAAGAWAVKRGIWDRWRQGKFIPWQQHGVFAMALATLIIPYTLIPISAMPLAVAINTMYHNVQYWGFVWMFERQRTQEFAKAETAMQLPQRLAFGGRWKSYFGLALAYSFIVCAFYLTVPQNVGLAFIYFLGFAHYIIDGHIWRRPNNSMLPTVMQRLVRGDAAVHAGGGYRQQPLAVAGEAAT